MLIELIFKADHNIYYIMEYIKRGDLFDFCKGKKLPENISKFFAAQIILGLESLHINEIIFRDLKLDNILIKDDYYLLLNDFGISRILKKGELSSTYDKYTSSYRAPEIIQEIKYSYSGSKTLFLAFNHIFSCLQTYLTVWLILFFIYVF